MYNPLGIISLVCRVRSPVYLSYVFIHSVIALEVYYLDLQSNNPGCPYGSEWDGVRWRPSLLVSGGNRLLLPVGSHSPRHARDGGFCAERTPLRPRQTRTRLHRVSPELRSPRACACAPATEVRSFLIDRATDTYIHTIRIQADKT